jgi:hypothetical protein
MFTILISILALMALLNIGGLLVMKIRLAKRAPSTSVKFAWWASGSDEVSDSYKRIYPGSYLPLFIQLTFLLLLLMVVGVLIAVLWK